MEIQYFLQPDVMPGGLPLAARAGDFVFFAGGIAAHPVKGVPDEVKPVPGYPYHGSSIDRQLRYIYNNMSAILDTAGSSIKRIMKINSYHTNPAEIDTALRLRKDYFGTEMPPPSTLVLVPELFIQGASVTNDVMALARNAKMDRQGMHKETDKVPLPTHDKIYGHPIYTQAVRGGGFVFAAGLTASTPIRRKVPGSEGYRHPDFPYRDNPIKFETRVILNYLKSLFDEMQVSFDHVVKADLHMTNTKDIAGMDEVWQEFFPKDPPARIVLPTDVVTTHMAIEIELFAIDPKGPYRKEIISTSGAPNPIGCEPQAVKAGPYLFFSTQLATNYKQGLAPEAQADPHFPYHTSSVKKHVKYILKNVEAICQAAGTSAKNLVRRRAMHVDLNEWSDAEEAWRAGLGDRVPPTTTFRTPGPLPVQACSVGYELVGFIPSEF